MKKLTTLVLAAGLVVSAFAGSASAGEFKPVLQFAEEFTYVDGGKYSDENFNAATRIRFGFDYVASEDLSATILFQYRKGSWGHNGDDFTADPAAHGETPAFGDHFRMRLAYIDWTIPSTDIKVRMGRQPVVTPSYAFGSPILDGRGDAVSVNGAINENISLGLTWLRTDSETNGKKYVDDKLVYGDDDADAVILNAEFAYDGFKIAPWAAYISVQKNAELGMSAFYNRDIATKDGEDASADAYVLGVSGELSMFDPFVFAIDALYSNTKLNNVVSTSEDTFDGFYVGAKASYKFSNGTAAFGGWYATGADESDRSLKGDDNGFVLLDGGFNASTILFGDNIIGCDSYNTLTDDSPFGTWGLIAEYAGFSFLENLSHTARVLYIEGTNENQPNAYNPGFGDSIELTEDDSAIEIDFDTTYQIYKNLSATLQLGYVFFDQSNLAPLAEEQDDIFRSALTFVYKF